MKSAQFCSFYILCLMCQVRDPTYSYQINSSHYASFQRLFVSLVCLYTLYAAWLLIKVSKREKRAKISSDRLMDFIKILIFISIVMRRNRSFMTPCLGSINSNVINACKEEREIEWEIERDRGERERERLAFQLFAYLKVLQRFAKIRWTARLCDSRCNECYSTGPEKSGRIKG